MDIDGSRERRRKRRNEAMEKYHSLIAWHINLLVILDGSIK
jgi:hypothetical protein